MPGVPESGNYVSVLDDQGIQQAVVQLRVRRDAGPQTIFTAIGEHDQQRAVLTTFAIQRHVVLGRAITAPLTDTDDDVRPAAACAGGSLVEECGDPGIEPDAGDIEEIPAGDSSYIDEARRAIKGEVYRPHRIPRHAERPRQSVAGSGRHETDGKRRPDEGTRSFVERSIAAPDDDARGVR